MGNLIEKSFSFILFEANESRRNKEYFFSSLSCLQLPSNLTLTIFSILELEISLFESLEERLFKYFFQKNRGTEIQYKQERKTGTKDSGRNGESKDKE
jgi:hypothetical protein